jgi:hypothetical protein
MKTKVIVVSAAVVLLGVVFCYYQTERPISYLDRSLLAKYPVLKNESEWRAKRVATDNPEAWTIPEKNVRVEVKNSQYDFYCGGKKAGFKNYSSYSNPVYVGAWNSVSVVDCGDFYFIYEYGDAGPKLFGPFENSLGLRL